MNHCQRFGCSIKYKYEVRCPICNRLVASFDDATFMDKLINENKALKDNLDVVCESNRKLDREVQLLKYKLKKGKK